jgi:hypothetical protein
MTVDHIRYDLLTQKALRGVLHHVLTDVAKNGLPGDHHFYISFHTDAPGVRISPRLLERHPNEMTIVLQHQFWDLTVTDQGFEVGLSFQGVPERLVIPFAAIKGFFDPSVQFGLQFEIASDEQASAPVAAAAQDTVAKPVAVPAPTGEGAVAASAEPSPATDTPAQGGAEVVQLDRFRKK